jgi:hypothetical protein
VLVFVVCVIPIQVWSIINLLYEIPAWIKRLDVWELVGVVSYTQAFALLESGIVFIFLVLLSAILPARLYRDRFVETSFALVFSTAVWAILAHTYDESIRLWGLKEFVPMIGLYLLSSVFLYLIVNRFKFIGRFFRSFTERLAVLAYLYLFIDIISVIIVSIRNF